MALLSESSESLQTKFCQKVQWLCETTQEQLQLLVKPRSLGKFQKSETSLRKIVINLGGYVESTIHAAPTKTHFNPGMGMKPSQEGGKRMDGYKGENRCEGKPEEAEISLKGILLTNTIELA